MCPVTSVNICLRQIQSHVHERIALHWSCMILNLWYLMQQPIAHKIAKTRTESFRSSRVRNLAIMIALAVIIFSDVDMHFVIGRMTAKMVFAFPLSHLAPAA